MNASLRVIAISAMSGLIWTSAEAQQTSEDRRYKLGAPSRIGRFQENSCISRCLITGFPLCFRGSLYFSGCTASSPASSPFIPGRILISKIRALIPARNMKTIFRMKTVL